MAQNLRVHRLAVTATPPAVNQLRVHRLSVNANQPLNALRVYRLSVQAVPAAANKLRIHRLALSSAAKPSAGVDITGIEPGDTFTWTGSGGSGGTGVWTQVGGAPASFTVSGTTITVKAPPTTTGTTCVFQYTVAGAFDQVFATIYNAERWLATASGWVGMVRTR